ncbi:MAG: hypothetical protein ACN4E2_03855 [Nitrospinota bacterium]
MQREPNFEEVLLTDEKIVWKGRPEPSIIFTKNDGALIPISISGSVMPLFMLAPMLNHINSTTDTLYLTVLGIVGALFLALSIYIIVGRFFYKYMLKLKTWYLITNKRVIIIKHLLRKTVQSQTFKDMNDYSHTVRSDAIGTILFENVNPTTRFCLNTGIEYLYSTRLRPLKAPCKVIAFYDIKNVKNVFQLVKDLKSKA